MSDNNEDPDKTKLDPGRTRINFDKKSEKTRLKPNSANVQKAVQPSSGNDATRLRSSANSSPQQRPIQQPSQQPAQRPTQRPTQPLTQRSSQRPTQRSSQNKISSSPERKEPELSKPGLPPGLPKAGLPNSGLPKAGLPNSGLPKPGFPNSGLPKSGSPNPGFPFGPADNGAAIPQSQPVRKITLKKRFLLEETLGVGGMGVVYKAIDKRKVEAKDRNPFIAIKILSEDFRQHPDAFMALQREARKSQSIAHPNIVNVHDFDRDGDTVFMTMEYMEGVPLDQLLKENRGIGLVKDHADRILADICAALAYAHKEYIIHADFKPGNIFVTNSGVTKVFDFGIARAVAQADRQLHHQSNDKSVFDPETLGALTPAYASPEMLRGAAPTAQDDIFALACVAYEMYSGEHPFKRAQADLAMEQKAKPKRIKSLSKQQWKALKRALSFSREDRPASVQEFLISFTQTKNSPLKKIISMAAVVVLGVGVYLQYFETRPLSPEALKAQLEAQIKIDLMKENLGELLAENRFSALWEAEIWDQVQTGRKLLGLKDQWLVTTEGEIVKLYLSQISQQRKTNQYSAAQSLLSNAERYRGYEDRLDNERMALNKAVGKMKDNQRLAMEKLRKQEEEQRKARALAALKAKKARKKEQADEIRRNEEFSKPKDVFALAMSNIKQQLRCTNGINTRNLDVAVKQAIKIDKNKFEKQRSQIISSLTVCIKQIARTNSNRAEDLKVFALTLFPRDRVLSSIRIKALDPCNASKAGLGARGKNGTCRDRFVGGGYGPRLVVVPENGKTSAFAIGQYEISIEQMNEYCEATKSCKPVTLGKNNLPITNISFSQAKSYAKWLSKKTGYRYRIPRRSEWLYAASADNSELDENRNCTVDSRGITKGDRLEEINTGKRNNWGLVNYVGNAQEWVLKNNRELIAAGGAHTDPISRCKITSARAHTGDPDPTTSFRLVRELRK